MAVDLNKIRFKEQFDYIMLSRPFTGRLVKFVFPTILSTKPVRSKGFGV